ncbi:MAG TPA: PrsW family glutamic-type intramembrane protease [Candidatus Paceibacterota bacterium]|jgi:RsiW-degrading membrane proteinase PrsW (M82 family)|nr:PrsW family glutamic-type intramembrane protease [Candidatus Paceibacterota bacterium]
MVEQLIHSPVLFALISGLLPALFWLFFWLHIDRKRPEPFGLLFLCFMLGAVSVLFASLLQHAVQSLASDGSKEQIAIFAAIEEILKYVAFAFVAKRSTYDDESIDPAIYMITVALGFAALENIFYVLQPTAHATITAALLTGGLRFFGATLLHTIASGFVGIGIALAPRGFKNTGAALGIAGAIFLHATFNFFILKNDASSFLRVYGYLWVAGIMNLLILEKLRRVSTPEGALVAVNQ